MMHQHSRGFDTSAPFLAFLLLHMKQRSTFLLALWLSFQEDAEAEKLSRLSMQTTRASRVRLQVDTAQSGDMYHAAVHVACVHGTRFPEAAGEHQHWHSR
jgi:hypothetical protein